MGYPLHHHLHSLAAQVHPSLRSKDIAKKPRATVCRYPGSANARLTICHSERTDVLPGGWFNWFKDFYRLPSTFVLNHSSIDGYLFLRFLRVLGVICLVGILLLWPILLPLHATGGAGNRELDALTLGNVVSTNRLYAHAILAWAYFGK